MWCCTVCNGLGQLIKEPGCHAVCQRLFAATICGSTTALIYLEIKLLWCQPPSWVLDYLQAFNYLGLCRVSMGDIRDGCRAYERSIELQPEMREAWLNLGQALKEEGRVKEAERALTKVRAHLACT
jgi:tetratricopeptide (TPR) repeat protein